MREFIAFPFYMMAKGFASIASWIDSEPCICFSLREATEVTEENLKELFDEEKKDE